MSVSMGTVCPTCGGWRGYEMPGRDPCEHSCAGRRRDRAPLLEPVHEHGNGHAAKIKLAETGHSAPATLPHTNSLLGEPFTDADGLTAYYSQSADTRIYRQVPNNSRASFNSPTGQALYVYANPDVKPPVAEGGVNSQIRINSQEGLPPKPPERVELPRKTKPWPVMHQAAYHSLAGDIVALIDPHTEADRAAVLLSLLLMVGNYVDREYYAEVSGSRHCLNEYLVLVGVSSRGRKGSSLGYLRQLFREIDLNCISPSWVNDHVVSGLSSGEGVIELVRDDSTKKDKDGNCLVPGVPDKRVLFLEEEFGRTLKVAHRDGSILSATLRDGWDHGNLRSVTRNDPLRATNAHLSIIGHITADELKVNLTDVEAANGFANRFLWALVRRSKRLADGGGSVDFSPVRNRLRLALVEAKAYQLTGTSPVRRDSAAAKRWDEFYYALPDDVPGLLGSLTARAEAHVLRLSLVFALLDRSPQIQLPHLEAALAVWDYSVQSVAYIFGDTLGDSVADGIMAFLATKGAAGADRSDIWGHFGRHLAVGRLQGSLENLLKAGAIREFKEQTEGRPRIVYVISGA
jgi:hypothetical protein